ncbi:MAG: hypothetical protein B7Z81_08335 [Acidocella sp. 20-61-6]|nr:MAG: hypothetical protein B7Z81_08335 [Acidocella sp. 20-61-6]
MMNMDGETDVRHRNVTSAAVTPKPEAWDVESLRAAILGNLATHTGKRQANAGARDWLLATCHAVRNVAVERWIESVEQATRQGARHVYYLSLEFLIGRLLFDNLNNLGLTEQMREALAGLDVSLDDLRALEPDAALGNGGLGRLAACFMESLATLNIPAFGYGIRYEHGLFRQAINQGIQEEFPEEWLDLGNPWEFERREIRWEIGFGGTVADGPAAGPRDWHPAETVIAVAYDTPVVGWRGARVNTLRLWSARPAAPLRLDLFNQGDHSGALAARMRAEAISKVLYPSDASAAGEELRLRQEYFFAAAALRDLVARHLETFGDIATLADKTAIQLNDTHPAIAVAELMRLLVDQHGVAWDTAWATTRAIFSYTNHTLMPEALETWPVALMERLLPRHMQIIYLINELHLAQVRSAHAGDDRLELQASIIDEQHGRRVRMGHLAFLGAHRVNGVSALHSGLMGETVFRDLAALRPGQIVNVTNGIAFRRWLHEANPRLTRLLTVGLSFGLLAHWKFGWNPVARDLWALPGGILTILSFVVLLSATMAHVCLVVLAIPMCGIIMLNDWLYDFSRASCRVFLGTRSRVVLNLAGLSGEIALFGLLFYLLKVHLLARF